MDIRLTLDLKLTQKLIITPQLQQAIKLLQLSHLELSQTIDQELIENPVLEEQADTQPDISSEETKEEARKEELKKEQENQEDNRLFDTEDFDYKWNDYIAETGDGRDWGYNQNHNDDFPSIDQIIPKTTSLMSHLLWQLNLSSIEEKQKKLAAMLIGNIDDDGYLRTSLHELEQLSGASITVIEDTLKTIQDFDPPGVCARDLRECLLLQVNMLDSDLLILSEIIENHLDDLVKKNYPKISRTLNAPLEEVFHAAKIIEGLEPKPGRPFSNVENTYITPDVYITKYENKYHVHLNDDGMPKLKINSYYKKLLQSDDSSGHKTKDYLENKFKSAIWLIKSIEQRNKTICKVTESIAKFQEKFLDMGVAHIEPLILKQVADDISMHESTISRVTANKFVHTPQGIFELKYFFNSNIPKTDDTGNGLSSITVREMIRKIISAEEPTRPLKDQEVLNFLKKKNIEIARRTIAKYRTELHIPPASRRKRFY